MSKEFKADCGHMIPALPGNHTGGTGYDIIRIGAIEHTRCYECCAKYIIQEMADSGKGALYFTKGYLSDWANILLIPTYNVRHGGTRRRPIITGRFVLPQSIVGHNGQVWAFRVTGDVDLARCKRLKTSKIGVK